MHTARDRPGGRRLVDAMPCLSWTLPACLSVAGSYVGVPLDMPPRRRRSAQQQHRQLPSGAMPPEESDGSDGSGSDIDPDEMPGEFSSTAENIAPDELPAEWFSDSAPDSAPSTPAAAAAATPPTPSTPAAGSSPPTTRPRSPSGARSYYAGSAPRPPPTPPLIESPTRLSNRAEGAPRTGGSPEGNLRRRAGQSPWAKKAPVERDEKEEEEEDRAVRQDSLKARPLAKSSTMVAPQLGAR